MELIISSHFQEGGGMQMALLCFVSALLSSDLPCSYDLMCRCWHLEPKLRPSFGALKLQLEMILARLSLLSNSQDPLYVNVGRSQEACRNEITMNCPFGALNGETGAIAAVTSDYRYIMNPSCLGNDAESERLQDLYDGEAQSLLYNLEMGAKLC